MTQRSFESPMEWEYNGSAPCDPSSPFTQVARGASNFAGFGSPSKTSGRPNPFAHLSSPNKSQQQPPQTPRFTPQIPPKATAPPFRNPAFTTPRRPLDEVVFSEASGAEDSPAPTEASDFAGDTPEVDHTSDVAMGGTITPTKVDKASRYGRSAHTKKHSSGKGEIRNRRDTSRHGLLRKRKRHNLDRDVGSVVRYQTQDESESDSDGNSSDTRSGRGRVNNGVATKRGMLGSMFHMLDEHPNAPENLHRWIQLGINMLVAATVVVIGWSVVSTVRSDIQNANEGARLEIMSKIAECNNQYTINECSKKDRPALRVMCDEWYDCMMQNPESIMRVKVTAKQIAEIINEFSETMNFKAWGFFFAIIIICVFGNNLVLGRSGGPSRPAFPHQSSSADMNSAMSGEGANGQVMWMPVQTPRMKRHAMIDDGSDTDSPMPRATPMMLPHYTPSGRRSPSKGERSRSPVKYSRSPSKGY